MKAGDVKKFLEKMISTDNKESVNPKDFNINDNFILNVVGAYKRGESPEHMKALVEGFIETESLTASRRVAVLKMIRDVLIGLSKPDISKEDRNRLRGLLTAYFI